MKIAIIGATGFIGSALLNEAIMRGHEVSAFVSNINKVPNQTRVTALQTNVLDIDDLAQKIKGHDIVISAFSGHAQKDVFDYYIKGIKSIIDAVKMVQIPRLIVVGGAGSLEVSPGIQLVDTADFPAEWKGTAEGARQALQLLRNDSQVTWTVLAPSAHIEPGKRTGNFRLGSKQLLVNEDAQSHISVEDYAVAMIDEVEDAKHLNALFTVGY